MQRIQFSLATIGIGLTILAVVLALLQIFDGLMVLFYSLSVGGAAVGKWRGYIRPPSGVFSRTVWNSMWWSSGCTVLFFIGTAANRRMYEGMLGPVFATGVLIVS